MDPFGSRQPPEVDASARIGGQKTNEEQQGGHEDGEERTEPPWSPGPGPDHPRFRDPNPLDETGIGRVAGRLVVGPQGRGGGVESRHLASGPPAIDVVAQLVGRAAIAGISSFLGGQSVISGDRPEASCL